MSQALPTIRGYRILQPLGEGGMGQVFLGEDELLERRVAIKMIRPDLAGEGDARERFLREARAMAGIEHPHVVRVYALGETEGQPYMVMEYVEGTTLQACVGSGRLPVERAMRIAHEVAQGLAAAWARGIVHRDVKPANIFLDQAERVKVGDFGLARPGGTSDGSITETGMVVGSPHYMAPEQVRGEDPDFRSDVYSLGIVLYEMLGGEKPFQGKSPAEVFARQLTEPVPPLSGRRPDVPPTVDALVRDMTAKAPAQRPSSYAHLLQRLAGTDHESVTATHASAAVRSAPPVRRRRALLALALVLAFTLAGLFTWTRSQARRASFSVVVAPLLAPDAESDKEGRVLAALLEAELRARLPDEDVEVVGSDEVGEPVRSVRGARALAEKLDADVVVWGNALALGGEISLASRVMRRDGTLVDDSDAAFLATPAGGLSERRARARAVAERVAALYAPAAPVTTPGREPPPPRQ